MVYGVYTVYVGTVYGVLGTACNGVSEGTRTRVMKSTRDREVRDRSPASPAVCEEVEEGA